MIKDEPSKSWGCSGKREFHSADLNWSTEKGDSSIGTYDDPWSTGLWSVVVARFRLGFKEERRVGSEGSGRLK